ncbi:MAG: hypothetical protein ACI97N_002359 [Cognaticolwellia sp.]|jgi:hypothetical protein
MKKLIYIFVLLITGFGAFAQNDTLLHENFNTIFDMVPSDMGAADNVAKAPAGPAKWVNYDADGIAVGGNGASQSWYWDSLDFRGDDLGVLKSQSWLTGFSPDNRNWLVLPALSIVDATAVLSWKSAPYQGPRYMDGYTVLVSKSGNDVTASANTFIDTLFQAAEMTSINTTTSSLSLSDYSFSDGYIHANSYTDSMYFLHPGEDTLNFTTAEVYNLGQLESHSVDLSAYIGYTIYIAFLHDSEDDNLIELDDILVMGTAAVISTDKISEALGLEIFPNPTRDYINLSYEVVENTEISAQIYDMQGRLMQVHNNLSSTAGEHQHRFDISNFAVGNYTIVIVAEGQRLSKSFTKQ